MRDNMRYNMSHNMYKFHITINSAHIHDRDAIFLLNHMHKRVRTWRSVLHLPTYGCYRQGQDKTNVKDRQTSARAHAPDTHKQSDTLTYSDTISQYHTK